MVLSDKGDLMKSHRTPHAEAKLITILSHLAICHLQESCAGHGLHTLLASRFWKRASADEKLHYLDQQFHHDFKAADLSQKVRMIRARTKIDRILATALN